MSNDSSLSVNGTEKANVEFPTPNILSMKINTIKLVIFALSLIISGQIFSQRDLSVGAEISTIIGNLDEYYNNSFGVSGQYEFDFTDKITAVTHTGFLYVPNDLDLGVLIYLIPIKAGIKYRFNERFYAQGLGGIYYVNAVSTFGAGSGSFFTFSAGLGAQLGSIDITPHIDLVGNGWSQAGIRIAYYISQ